MTTNRISAFFCVAVVFLGFMTFSSCISKPLQDYSIPDYSDDDIIDSTLAEIERLASDNIIKALWRAYLVFTESPSEKTSSYVIKFSNSAIEEYKKAIEEKKYYLAENYGHSLNVINEDMKKNYDTLLLSEPLAPVNNWFLTDEVPNLGKEKDNIPNSVSELISGTVTVWVDKGVKVEKGLGYADRVIGSGFFIDTRGYLVTNYHVIESEVDPVYEGYSRLFIKLATDPDTRIPAKVIGYDKQMDLALLKAEVTPSYVFTLGSSENLNIGDQIYAIGSPVGLDKTITSGVVSSTDRKIGTLGSVIQIDAAINSGNSGGPLVDKNGNVQGIVFAGLLQYEGLNFAMPIEYLKSELPALYNGIGIEHPWLGVYGQIKKEFASDKTGIGVEVLYVVPGSSAFYCGIEAGDIITKIGKNIVTSPEQLQDILIPYGTDLITSVTVIKKHNSNNTESKISYDISESETIKEYIVYLEPRPEYPGKEILERDTMSNAFYPIFGMKLLQSSTTNKKKYVITEIIKASIADESGFSVNDPIEIIRYKFEYDETYLYSEVYTKKRKSGYMDVNLVILAPMDSTYFF